MKAMVLAAGRGERLRPLTDTTPKPLLVAGGKPLIVWTIEHLKRNGFVDLVVNTGWLGEQIPASLGDGSQFGVNIEYSTEPPTALGTGGGIYKALPLLGPAPFLVINADVWTDFSLQQLTVVSGALANILLTDNPPFHPGGDFSLADSTVSNQGPNLTYTGIGVFRPALFDDCQPKAFGLGPLLHAAADEGRLQRTKLSGHWFNVGTEGILTELDTFLKASCRANARGIP